MDGMEKRLGEHIVQIVSVPGPETRELSRASRRLVWAKRPGRTGPLSARTGGRESGYYGLI